MWCFDVFDVCDVFDGIKLQQPGVIFSFQPGRLQFFETSFDPTVILYCWANLESSFLGLGDSFGLVIKAMSKLAMNWSLSIFSFCLFSTLQNFAINCWLWLSTSACLLPPIALLLFWNFYIALLFALTWILTLRSGLAFCTGSCGFFISSWQIYAGLSLNWETSYD